MLFNVAVTHFPTTLHTIKIKVKYFLSCHCNLSFKTIVLVIHTQSQELISHKADFLTISQPDLTTMHLFSFKYKY